jgi:hypothetical protein
MKKSRANTAGAGGVGGMRRGLSRWNSWRLSARGMYRLVSWSAGSRAIVEVEEVEGGPNVIQPLAVDFSLRDQVLRTFPVRGPGNNPVPYLP